MTSTILSLTEAFPPAHKATQTLMSIDYKKHLNSFMDAVEITLAFIAAIVSIALQKWQEYDMTERTQIALLKASEWVRNVAVPNVKKAALATYQAGVEVRNIYNAIRLPLMMTL